MILIILCLQSEKKVIDKSLYSSSSSAVTTGKTPKISSFSSLNNSWRLASWVTSTFLIVSSSFSWVVSLLLGNNLFCRLARWRPVFEIALGIVIIWLDLISIVNFRLLTVTHDITLHSAFHSLLCADNCLGCWVEKNITHCHSKCTVCVGKVGNCRLIKDHPHDDHYPVDVIIIFLKQSAKASAYLRRIFP